MDSREIYDKVRGIGADLLVFSGMEYLLNTIRYFSQKRKNKKNRHKNELPQ
jgi:hypothetical protein